MHRVILLERMNIVRPSEKHFCDHDNEDSLDNRRFNDKGRQQLQWLTAKENAAKRSGRSRICIPALPPESGLTESGDEIPY